MASQIISVSRETLEEVQNLLYRFGISEIVDMTECTINNEVLYKLKKKIDSLLWIDEKKM